MTLDQYTRMRIVRDYPWLLGCPRPPDLRMSDDQWQADLAAQLARFKARCAEEYPVSTERHL